MLHLARILPLLFLCEPQLGIAQLYEPQLAHRHMAIVSALEDHFAEGEVAEVEFQCLTERRENAEELIAFHAPLPGKIEEQYENWFTAIITFSLDPRSVDWEQWVRTQFFIGIAYFCDMNLIQPVAQHNNPLKPFASLTRTRIKPAPLSSDVMCVMAQNKYHQASSQFMGQLQGLELGEVGPSARVPGNMEPDQLLVVAFSVALQAVKLEAAARDQVVAIIAAGFGRAFGRGPSTMRASHITNRSSSFRPSASTGRAKARRLAQTLAVKRRYHT